MKNLVKKLKLKVTKHFLVRMEERQVTEKMVEVCLKNGKMKPGNNPETVKIVFKNITVVITKSRELLSCYVK